MINNRYITLDEAAKTPCPIARTFPDGKSATCDGPKCILWRWREIMASDPVFMAAIQRAQACIAQDAGEGKPGGHYHKQAVQQVARDPLAWDVKTDFGYCGLGGKP